MSKHSIKFYPVGNGDMTHLNLKDETNILIDCKIREGDTTNDGNSIFPVKDDLVKSIKKRGENPYLDLFILTHPDQDHCQGFDKHFYTGNPSNYGSSNRQNNEILVDELWVTSLLFNWTSNEDAKALKKEAERRRKLWEQNDSRKNDPGNRLRMIGYDGDNKFECLPNSVPGDTINEINNEVKGDFEFFVHGPFKSSLIDCNADGESNNSSIIMQARFKANSTDEEHSCLYLFGGDADHYRWKEVLEKSKYHGNEDKLNWDIFLTPHHCSWTYFNDTPYNENKTSQASSLDILNYKIGNGKVIAACKPIKNNDDNPPHHYARAEYLKKVDSANFIELAEKPSKNNPKPYVFEITSQGPSKKAYSEGSAFIAAGGSSAAVNQKSEYGA